MAVLLLIALATILVVVTSFMARIERRAVFNEANEEIARQNALFGLDVALAQLQKAAGPDQRITARADILDSNPATVAADGFPAATTAQPNNPGQAYWTGVWKTGNAPPDAFYTAALPTPSSSPTPQRTTSLGNPSPTTAQKVQKATWLVSDPIDPSTNLPVALDPTATPSPSQYKTVTLAENLPDLTGGASTVGVSVPLVPMFGSATAASPSATPAGKYAYWVADEGVKAKVNLTDPTYTGAAGNGNSAFVESQLHFVGPQAVATQDGLFGAANTNDIRVPQYAADVPKVSTLQSLGYVQGSASTPVVTGVSGSAAAKFSPDVTTYSYGVLADVRNGGLKTDLSQLFEDPANQFGPFLTSAAVTHTADPAADQKIWSLVAPFYGNSASQVYPAEFGVRWQSVYDYYSLYKSVSSYPSAAPWSNLNYYSNGNPGTNAPQMDARLFSYTSNPIGTPGGATQQQPGEYYMPHLIGYGIYFSMSSQQVAPTGSNPHDYHLILYAQPRVVLYNPYNVTLSVSKAGNNPYLLWLSSNVLSRTLTVTVGGTKIVNEAPTWLGTFTTNSNGTQSSNTTDAQWQMDPAANFVLKPGEIRVYGLGTLAQASQFGYVATFPKIGDKVGQSQWQYLGTDASGVVNPNSATEWQANVPDSADVTVSYAGNAAFASNDGYYKQYTGPNGGPGVWPNTSSPTNNVIGRFFNNPPNEAAQSADLGPISGMASASPNSSAAIPFGYFVIRAKGLAQGETSAAGNPGSYAPLPTFSSSDGSFNPLPMYFDSTMEDTDFSLAVQNTNSLTEMQVSGTSPPFNSYWGSQDVALNPNDPSFLILRDVPRQPMISLGQFMHMPMRTSSYINVTTGNGWSDTNSCLMGVGGSLANPYVKLTDVWDNLDYGVPRLDDNFLMNQALFDTYYFSSVPPPVSLMDASYKAVLPALATGATAFTDANILKGTCVLPNSRMSFYAKNGIRPQTTSSAAQNYLPNNQKAAANLLLNGAFNVNSTSVAAWRALLSSLSGNNPTGGLYTGPAFSSTQYPIFRFLSPTPVMSSSVTTFTSPNPWASINILTEQPTPTPTSSPSPTPPPTQVTALATSIVKEVKRLGPFLSMADFLNRRLTTASDAYGPIGLKGALQAAIDDSSLVNINTNILALGSATGNATKGARGNPPGNAIAAQLPNNTAIGTPGCLMQQDLVQCFSPIMTVRSDTFLVRCYGEADNIKTGATQGRAWGEALVQRLPDYVDQTDPALSAGSNLGDATPLANVSVTNQTFGRRFKVVSFRWLNETDL